MEKHKPVLEQPKIFSLAEVPAIEESRNQMIVKREQLKKLIEQPLLEACEELYDKNIRTLSASANQRDIQAGEVYIIIDFDSLSEENQRIAQQYAEPIDYDDGKAVKVIIPVTDKTALDEIIRETKKIAGTFQKQPAIWIPVYTLENIQKTAGKHGYKDIPDDPEYWAKETGYFYDPKSKNFYLSEEHFQKANEEKDVK